MTWTLVYSRHARKDPKKLAAAGLTEKASALLELVARDPFASPPPHEKPVGDLSGACSRRINIRHRLVYQVIKAGKTVKILRMWTHYE